MGKVAFKVSLVALAVIIVGAIGCAVVSHNQPGSGVDGVQFTVTVDCTVNDLGNYDPGYALICIMLPTQFTVDSGTYDAGALGSGVMVNADAAGVPLCTTYYDGVGHTVPASYKWTVWRTSGTYDPTGTGADIPVTFVVNITPHVARTGQDYWISYAVGATETDWSVYSFGFEDEQSWENDITIGHSAVEDISLGGIKAKFE